MVMLPTMCCLECSRYWAANNPDYPQRWPGCVKNPGGLECRAGHCAVVEGAGVAEGPVLKLPDVHKELPSFLQGGTQEAVHRRQYTAGGWGLVTSRHCSNSHHSFSLLEYVCCIYCAQSTAGTQRYRHWQQHRHTTARQPRAHSPETHAYSGVCPARIITCTRLPRDMLRSAP